MIGSGTTGGDLDAVDSDIAAHRAFRIKIITGAVFIGVPAHKVLGTRSRVGGHIFAERGASIYIQNIVDRPVGCSDRLVHKCHCILAYRRCVVLKGQLCVFPYTLGAFRISKGEVIFMEDSPHIVLYIEYSQPFMSKIQSYHNSVDFAGRDLLPGGVGKVALVGIAVGNIFLYSIAVCIRAILCNKSDAGDGGIAHIVCVVARSGNGCHFPLAFIHKPDSVYGFTVSSGERRNRQQCQHHAQHHERRQYSLFHFAIFLLTV